MLSTHRLQRGLLGYLIPFAPHAFVPERQDCSSKLLSPLVFLSILTHFTATPIIPLASTSLEKDRIACSPEVKLQDLTCDVSNRLRTLYAQLIRVTLATFVLPLLLARS